MASMELLAPAGNPRALNAAVRAGADAVYLGLGAFNARRNADNFTAQTLLEACDYAHLRGARIYVTLNTLILPSEVDDALSCAREAYEAGADAFIVQDIGLAEALSTYFPQVRLHISTQMNSLNAAALRAAARLGARRVTLGRELSLQEIHQLAQEASELGMEIEVFAHGALCVCYSGQCYLSSMIGGRSANRGMCAQACRLPYTLLHGSREVKSPGEHLLSPKDLAAIDLLPQLKVAGVASLKIEGRMKSPEYVAAVVGVYRSVLDRVEQEGEASSTDQERDLLSEAFSRGFTQGYLVGERGDDLMSFTRPNNRGIPVGRISRVSADNFEMQTSRPLHANDVLEVWTKKGNVAVPLAASFSMEGKRARVPLDRAQRLVRQGDRVFRVRNGSMEFEEDTYEPRIPLEGAVQLHRGKPLEASFSPASEALAESPLDEIILHRLAAIHGVEAPQGQASGPMVEAARTKAVSREDVAAHIDRLGTTSYALRSLDVQLDDGVGIGFSALHHVRSDALEALSEKLTAPWKQRPHVALPHVGKSVRTFGDDTQGPASAAEASMAVLATNPDCARAAKRAGADRIYVPALNLQRGQAIVAGLLDPHPSQAGYPKRTIPVLPVADHDAVGLSRESLLGSDIWKPIREGKPVIAESLGDLQRAWEEDAIPEVGSHLPVTNVLSLSILDSYGVTQVWLSPELTLEQIRSLTSARPEGMTFGLTVYGAQELMVTEHCLLTGEGPCNQQCTTCSRRRQAHRLKDRKGYEFPVVTDALGRSHLYNSVPLDIIHAVPELLEAGVSFFLIDSTLLTQQETVQTLSRLSRALESAAAGTKPEPKPAKATTGHLFRGVA